MRKALLVLLALCASSSFAQELRGTRLQQFTENRGWNEATAKSYAIPRGALKQGERYVFQVTLEDLEGGEVRNRSMAFSEPYTVK